MKSLFYVCNIYQVDGWMDGWMDEVVKEVAILFYFVLLEALFFSVRTCVEDAKDRMVLSCSA